MSHSVNCTEVRFASFLSGGFTTMAVIDPPERKLAKRTSVNCLVYKHSKDDNLDRNTYSMSTFADRKDVFLENNKLLETQE